MNDFQPFANLIQKTNSFVVATHVQPDGDGISSLLGLGLFLSNLGKEVCLSWGEPILRIPPQYTFLPGANLIKPHFECPKKPEVFIALDCANIERLGNLIEEAKSAITLVNIDHHADNEMFGVINIVDGKASATTEVIFDLIKYLNEEIDHSIALCLYTGLVTDTGKFQYSNTSKKTLKMAEELLGYGVSPNFVFQNVYENYSHESVKLLMYTLQKLNFLPEIGLAYSVITQKDLVQTGAKMEETENFIDIIRGINGTKVAAILKELPDKTIKVSLRSNGPFNVIKIAEKFGGGGHPNAAGFSSPFKEEKTIEILIDLTKKLTQTE